MTSQYQISLKLTDLLKLLKTGPKRMEMLLNEENRYKHVTLKLWPFKHGRFLQTKL